MSAAWVLVLIFWASNTPNSGLALYFVSKDMCEVALHDYTGRAGIEARCHMVGPGNGDFGLIPTIPHPRGMKP